MKFSDAAIAAALLFVVSFILCSFLAVPFVSLKNYTALVSGVVSGLIVSIIVGYLFAVKIKEDSRLRTIGIIALLATVAAWLLIEGWSANPLASPAIKDMIQSMFKTAAWTDYDWYSYTAFVVALETLVFFVVNFVGLYIGSMLNRKRV